MQLLVLRPIVDRVVLRRIVVSKNTNYIYQFFVVITQSLLSKSNGRICVNVTVFLFMVILTHVVYHMSCVVHI